MDQTPAPTALQFKSISYTGLQPGPRLIVLGAVHGNETCGTRAIARIVEEIESGRRPIERGSVTFVPVANPLAYARGERAGDRNLNRNLGPVETPADFEDHVANWLCPLLARHDVLLDLHSTRAATEPFAMLGPRDNAGDLEPFAHSQRERSLGRRLGVRRFVEGWLGTYAHGVARRVREGLGSALNTDARYGVGTTEYMRSVGGYAITLECGQHDDPSSPQVAYRAIGNTLAFLGLTGGEAPAPVADYEALRIREVVDKAHAQDRFSREWSSFDRLAEGDVIAVRHDGTVIAAEREGWILFPDAKSQPGHEWFYLAEPMAQI
jgi:predicted deacylase